MKRNIAAAMAMVFCLIFYWLSVSSLGRLQSFDGLVTFVTTESSYVTEDIAKELRKQNEESEVPMSYSFWGSVGDVTVSADDTNGTDNPELLVVSGRSDLLFPSSISMDEEDIEGCLVSRSTAIALYGTSEATGLTVKYNGKNYTIIGMINETDDTIVMESGALSNVNMNSVTVKTDDTTTLGALKEKVESQLSFKGELLEYRSLNGIAHILTLLLPLLIAIFLLRIIWKEIKCTGKELPVNPESDHVKRDISHIKKTAVGWAIFAVILIVFVLLFTRNISVPQDLIPTKWSDFDFWSVLWTKKKDAFLLLLKCEKRQPELYYIGLWVRSIIYSVLTIVMYVCACVWKDFG